MTLESKAKLPNENRDFDTEKRWHKSLTTEWFGQQLYVFSELESTMDVASKLVGKDDSEGTVIAALSQTRGRGRLGRQWVSSQGGLYFSYILNPPIDKAAHEVAQIGLIAGLAAAECVQTFVSSQPWIRWPNDVLIGKQKIAGLLAERQANTIIVGLGVNVLQDRQALPDIATSIKLESKAGASLDAVLNVFGARFEIWYARWLSEGFDPIQSALRFWLQGVGDPVSVKTGNALFEGQSLGVDGLGRFLLRLDTGQQKAFDQGEVTLLRPIET